MAVTGQNETGIDATKRRLFTYMASNRVHPSLLLVGPNRDPKFLVAIEMAQFLLCKKRVAVHPVGPCRECSDCRRVIKRTHPDLIVFGEKTEEEEEDHIKIESIRELTHHMELSSHEGQAKVCVVDEAHRMNTAAQSAFLKTLEEPGSSKYFLLLSTQPGRLLSTVLSRCLTFSFKPDTEARLLSADERKRYSGLFSEAIKAQSFTDLTEALSEKADVLQFVCSLQYEMREKLVEGRVVPALENHSPYELTLIFESLLEMEGRLRSNANPTLLLENFLYGFLDKTNLES